MDKERRYFYRAEITKGEEVRYISHLDYAAIWQRAMLRAKIPVAYTEGFNPHMKLAFASALAVGVTSDAEYMDVELARPLGEKEFLDRLGAQLPKGVRVLRARASRERPKALMSEVDMAKYEILVPLEGEFSLAQKALASFRAAGDVIYRKITPKKTRDIAVKQYARNIALRASGGDLLLAMDIRITPAGSIKPGEVLLVLKNDFGMPVDERKARISRRALLGKGRPLIDLGNAAKKTLEVHA